MNNFNYIVNVEKELPFDLKEELIDRLNYVSKEIEAIEFTSNKEIKFLLNNDKSSEKEKIRRMIERFYHSYKNFKSTVLFDNQIETPNHSDIWKELVSIGAAKQERSGTVILSGICIDLFDYFNRKIKEIGFEFGAVEYKYPTLISIDTMQKIKYLSSRPESLNFVSNIKEDMDMIEDFSKKAKKIGYKIDMNEMGDYFHTDYINSSAVCFHTYEQHKNSDLKLSDHPLIISSEGKCFRYESKSMVSLERLRDFTMREIICLGTENMIKDFIEKVIKRIKELFILMELNYYIANANDPFFVEEFSVQSTFQRTFGLKFEFNARINGHSNKLAVGSINNHRDFLGKSFEIKNNGEIIHSSCAAFGIERCVLAFLDQYGTNNKKWPDFVVKDLYL